MKIEKTKLRRYSSLALELPFVHNLSIVISIESPVNNCFIIYLKYPLSIHLL